MPNSRIIFVTGGQRSGKSRFAERLVTSLSDNPVYLATALVNDEEMERRVEVHRQRRGSNWSNIEAPLTLAAHLHGRTVLLDCLTMFATNHFFYNKEMVQPTIDSVKAQLDRLFSNDDAVIVVVSNEIGLGGVSPNKMQRNFCDIQGTLNQYVASLADEAYLIVSGLPLRLI
jgi:adenosylcobinamide kinase/adenosylcobinamide-phosphate guanylyltransferase